MTVALTIIVGAHGQDGRILTETLKKRGHKLILVGREEFNILNASDVESLILHKPDFIYYLAAYHHPRDLVLPDQNTLVKNSNEINFIGFLNFLNAINKKSPRTRIFYASSCHIYDGSSKKLNELSAVNPKTPYALSKYKAQKIAKYYREHFGTLASVGILFNHESNYRKAFLSHKIISTAKLIRKDPSIILEVGEPNAIVDWGSAFDYVEAMIAIMDQELPDTYVIATGKGHSVKDFIEIVFNHLQIDYSKHVRVNPRLLVTPHQIRIGDPTKIHNICGWKPKIGFQQLVESLVNE